MLQKIGNKIQIDLSIFNFSITKFNCFCIILLSPFLLFVGYITLKFSCSILWTVLYGVVVLHLNIFNLGTEQLIYLSMIYFYHIVFIMYYVNILYNKEYEKFKKFRYKRMRLAHTDYAQINGIHITFMNEPPLLWIIHNLKLLILFKIISFSVYLNLFYYGVFKYNEKIKSTECCCAFLIMLIAFSLVNSFTRVFYIERGAIKKYNNNPYYYD